jgi:aspartyl-tRNA(Asn)/glutamyl-tRNA(Gln) amidotransferase subunit A
LLLNVISRPDARDWHALPDSSIDSAAELNAPMKGKRIAFSPRLGYVQRVSRDVETLVAAAAHCFAEMGAEVEEIDPPGGDPSSTFRTLWWAGAGFLLGDLPAEKKALLDTGLREMVESGRTIGLRDYLAATAARGAYGGALRQFMQRFDFLLTPAVATAAFDTGRLAPLDDDGNAWMSWTPFSFPFNLTQQPAASVPCGFTKDGLPVGLQIVGRMFDDAGVLAASASYETANPAYRLLPPGC